MFPARYVLLEKLYSVRYNRVVFLLSVAYKLHLASRLKYFVNIF